MYGISTKQPMIYSKTKEEESNFKCKVKNSLDIDIEKFEFSAGLRSIKLCLSSIWGKFGQRSNMAKASEFYEVLLDDKLDNLNIQFLNDVMVQMTYNFKDQFVDNSKYTKYTSHASQLVM